MKNSNSHKITKSPVRQITTFSVLAVIVFLAISCNLNAGGNGNTEEAVKILTGPCGETKENSNDVVEINGQKYYTTKSNYYALKTDTTSEEAKMRAEITDEDLYDDIRVKYWNEWIPGSYTVFGEKGYNCFYNYVIDEHSGANGYIAHSWRGKWIVNKEKAEFRRFPTYDGSLFEVVTEDIIKFVGKGTTYKEK